MTDVHDVITFCTPCLHFVVLFVICNMRVCSALEGTGPGAQNKSRAVSDVQLDSEPNNK